MYGEYNELADACWLISPKVGGEAEDEMLSSN